MAEQIEMPFGLCTRLGSGKHVPRDVVLMGAHRRNLTNMIEPSMFGWICGDDAALCQITLTTCYYFSPQIVKIARGLKTKNSNYYYYDAEYNYAHDICDPDVSLETGISFGLYNQR